jgi:hypothetical protein
MITLLKKDTVQVDANRSMIVSADPGPPGSFGKNAASH